MNKPDLKDVQELIKIKEQIVALYAEQDELLKTLFEKHGEGRSDYAVDDAEHPYLKFVIIDVMRQLQAGETVWKSTAVKGLTFESRALKRKPKGL